MHQAKEKGETSKIKLLMVVAIGVLEKKEAIKGEEVKGGSNTSSRSIKQVLSTKLDSRGRDDS